MNEGKFHPWEIWNGGECPCPGEMVQVQLDWQDRRSAEASNPQQAVGRSPAWAHWAWDWSQPLGDHARIIAFRRVKKPETVTLTGCNLSGWIFGIAPSSKDTHRLTFNVDADGNPYNFHCERITE